MVSGWGRACPGSSRVVPRRLSAWPVAGFSEEHSGFVPRSPSRSGRHSGPGSDADRSVWFRAGKAAHGSSRRVRRSRPVFVRRAASTVRSAVAFCTRSPGVPCTQGYRAEAAGRVRRARRCTTPGVIRKTLVRGTEYPSAVRPVRYAAGTVAYLQEHDLEQPLKPCRILGWGALTSAPARHGMARGYAGRLAFSKRPHSVRRGGCEAHATHRPAARPAQRPQRRMSPIPVGNRLDAPRRSGVRPPCRPWRRGRRQTARRRAEASGPPAAGASMLE